MKSSTEQLRDIAELLDRGLISRGEFDAQKAAILAQGTGSAPRLGASSLPPSIGAYTILGLVGSGGMGVVYRGRHRLDARAQAQGGDVAIKVLHPQYARAEGFARRFEREANLGTRLDHPGIVKAYDLIVEGETLALIMELVQGQPLSRMIGEQTGPLPWDRALPMFRQLLDAVGYAHAQGVVHRDLKPDNVVVTPDGRLHILDFGIARERSSNVTGTGIGMGTVAYMAPEQYRDARSVDARADIYALGMTLYEMLAGRLPWDAATSEFEILTVKAAGDLPPPTAYYPRIPAPITAVLDRALEAGLDRRLTSTEAFAAALDDAEQKIRAPRERPQAASPQPVPTPEPRRWGRGCLLGLAIGALFVLLAVLVIFCSGSGLLGFAGCAALLGSPPSPSTSSDDLFGEDYEKELEAAMEEDLKAPADAEARGPAVGGGGARGVYLADNVAACKYYVEHYNGLACLREAGIQLDADDVCPTGLNYSPIDMRDYYTCMAENSRCSGSFPDMSGVSDCRMPDL